MHDFSSPKFELSRFRILVSDAQKPEDGFSLPGNIPAILAAPADERTDEQKKALSAYYRTIAPSLKATRDKISDLQNAAVFPPVVKVKETAPLVVVVQRNGFEGDITLNVEGFSTGIENGGPAPIAKNVEIKPVTLKGKETRAVLTLKPTDKAEKGTRSIIVKLDATANGQPYTQYSQTFPLTVK